MSTRPRPPIRGLLITVIAAAGLVASIVVLLVVLAVVAPSLRRGEVDRQARELRGQVAAAAQANRLREPITRREATALARRVQEEVGGEVRVTYGIAADAPPRVITLPRDPEYLPLFATGGEAAFTLLDGPERRAVASRSPLYAGGDAGSLTRVGSVTVAKATSGTSPELERAQRLAFISAGAILVLSVITGWALSALIGGPAVRLSRTTRRLAEGDLSARAPEGGPRELASLSVDVNAMATRVDDLVRDLTDERDRTAAIIASLAEGVVAVDGAGRMVMANEVARELLHLGSGDVTGRPLPPSKEALLRTRDEQLLELPGGRIVAALAVPLGQGEGSIITLRDVTSEQRLAQARRDLVANVSHELKTPVTGIRGLQELIAQGDHAPDEQSELIALIGVEVARLERLVEEQLELARLDAGEMRLELAPTDLAAVAERALGPRRRLAQEDGVELVAVPPAPQVDPVALADTVRVEQVILILVDNALAHTPRGGRIEVSLDGDTTWARLTVRDTGEGIPADEQAVIFDRFYRRDDSRARPGTGLGLAIARGIARAHGGTLEVTSAAGEGSAFTVTLPRPPDQAR